MLIRFLPVLLVFLPMVAGILSYLIGRRSKTARDVFVCAFAFVELGLSVLLWTGGGASFSIDGLLAACVRFEAGGMQCALSTLASVVWVFATLLAPPYFAHARRRNRFYLFMLLTLGATQGVFLAGDLMTLFVFFEIMSFTSYALVKQEETPQALRAGQTYLALSVTAGLVALLGLYWLYHLMGTLELNALTEVAHAVENRGALYVACAMVLIGFAAKAGMFPLHFWLPDVHPAAPAPATILLSSILIKTGVFGILILSARVLAHDAAWGAWILALGAITMLLGALLALPSTDLKRTLACSSLSQVGFILVGLGAMNLLGHHQSIAIGGAMAHIVNHSLIKLVLFGAAGIIYMNAHTLDLNALRGWGRGKPFLALCFLIGGLSIAGVPGLNGFISKTLLHEALTEYLLLYPDGAYGMLVHGVEWAFILSGGLTLAYMTKLFVAIFIEKPSAEFSGQADQKNYMPIPLRIAFAVVAAALVLFGLLPERTLIPIAALAQAFVGAEPFHALHLFTAESIQSALLSIGIGAAVYGLYRLVLMGKDEAGRRVYIDRTPRDKGLEALIYRPLAEKILPTIGFAIATVFDRVPEVILAFFRKMVFNKDDERTEPKTDEYFSVYSEEPYIRTGFTDTLAFSFLLLGLGVAAALVYLLFH